MRDWIDSYEKRAWQTTENGTVRYALIGLGWWTIDVALPAIESSDLGEVTVLVSSSTDKATRLADENDIAGGISYDEFHDGAAADEYDAVYVGTPNAYHLEYAETAAELDKAVLCEKPMEATVERAERMVATCDAADVPLMIAYRMQTDPPVQRARELIADGFLGEPVSVYGHNTQSLLEMIPDPDQWRLDADLSGYGTSVMDLGIYSINTTRFLLRRDPISVQAEMVSKSRGVRRRPGRAVFVAADLRRRRADDLDLEPARPRRYASQDHGNRGTDRAPAGVPRECSLHLSRGDVSVTVEHRSFDAEREMEEEFDYFADCLLGDGDLYPDGRHGLQDMRIIEALHDSAERGEPVALE